MPSALAITRSSGVVMKPRTRSALAPMYAVDTVITAISLRGYWRTESDRIDWMPAIRMTRLTTIARTGRRMKMSVIFILGIRRFGLGGVRRRDVVVHLHRGTAAQLEHARRDDFLPRVHTREHRHLVAARIAQLHELLAHALVLLLVGTFHVLDDEHGVAVRRIRNRRSRQRHHFRLLAQHDRYFDEHAR